MLRPANHQDCQSIWKIYTEPSVNFFMDFPPQDFISFKNLFERFITESECYVYEVDQNVVGFCRIIYGKKTHSHCATIASLGILPNFRQRGIAQHILKNLIKHLQNQPNIYRIELGVEADNPIAKAFYLSLGFHEEVNYSQWFRRNLSSEQDMTGEIFMCLFTEQKLKKRRCCITHYAAYLPFVNSIARFAMRFAKKQDAQFRIKPNRGHSSISAKPITEDDYPTLITFISSPIIDQNGSEFCGTTEKEMVEELNNYQKGGTCYGLKFNEDFYGIIQINVPPTIRRQHYFELHVLALHPDLNKQVLKDLITHLIQSTTNQNRIRAQCSAIACQKQLIGALETIGFKKCGLFREAYFHPKTSMVYDRVAFELGLTSSLPHGF